MSKKKLQEGTFDSITHYTTDAAMLRESIVEELNAINKYKAMAQKASDPEVRDTLEHVIEEEKHHIGEFQAMIKKLDKDYMKGLKAGEQEVEDRGVDLDFTMNESDNLTEKEIRIAAASKIVEDDNYCCPTVKKQLINYFKECDIQDAKAYLLDGEFDVIDEDAKDIIDQRFEKEEIREEVKLINESLIGMVLGISSLIALGPIVGEKTVKAIRRNATKCARKCKQYDKDDERRKFKVCKLKCQIESGEASLEVLKKVDCSKAEDQNKCKEKVKNNIQKLEKQLAKKKEKLNNMTKAD